MRKKAIKLTQTQLRSLISEVNSEPTQGPMPGDITAEVARKLAQTFATMLSPEPPILKDLEHELNHTLDQDSFWPTRFEDIEPMAEAAAKQAARILATHPDFIGLLSDALARSWRQGLKGF